MERGEFQQSVAPQEKKSGRGLLFVTAFFALATVVLGACLAFTLMKGDNGESAKTNDNKPVAEANKEDSDEKVRNIINDVYDVFVEAAENYRVDKNYGNDMLIPIDDDLAIYANKWYGFSFKPNEYLSKELEKNNGYAKLEKTVTDALSKKGIKKVSQPKSFHYANMDVDLLSWYEGDGIFCEYEKLSEITLSCADKSWYTDEQKELTLALRAAYKKKTGEEGSEISIPNAHKIEKKNGYEHLVAYDSNAVAHYYRKDGGEWKYFISTQAPVSCDKYDTDELKEAYNGTICYDSTTYADSVVKK